MKTCSCGKLEEFKSEGKVQINYSSRFRQYSIPLKNSNASQTIHYCPWCGDKLPEALGDRWFDELEAMGFENPFEQCRADENFPEKYKTDAWWRKSERT